MILLTQLRSHFPSAVDLNPESGASPVHARRTRLQWRRTEGGKRRLRGAPIGYAERTDGERAWEPSNGSDGGAAEAAAYAY